jgi:hypothetical protein
LFNHSRDGSHGNKTSRVEDQLDDSDTFSSLLIILQ